MVVTQTIAFETEGHADVINVTDEVARTVQNAEIRNGIVCVFSPSATSAITTIEYESGCVADLKRTFEELVPENREYKHNLRWGDGNGHSHVRAALLGAGFTVPVVDGRLTLGTWQQIVFVDFDNRPRSRELVVQIVGES